MVTTRSQDRGASDASPEASTPLAPASDKKRKTVRSTKAPAERKRRRTSAGKEDTTVVEDQTQAQPELEHEVPESREGAAAAAQSKPRRIRFGSEEPGDVTVPAAEEVVVTRPQDETSDSEDDAPEDVSTAAAQKATKDVTSGAARAIELQRTAQKEKRRARDTRLKEQAEATKRLKPKKGDQPIASQKRSGHTGTADEATPAEGKPRSEESSDDDDDEDDIDLLPAELLAQEFTRPPTPPPEKPPAVPADTSKRRMHIRHAPSPPRDRQVGRINVSVLEKANRFLPPKANEKSKLIRESWLKGRLGRGGAAVFQRKPVNAGFLRR